MRADVLSRRNIIVDNKSILLPTVAGLSQFSTVDYPGHLCAVIYTQGCPCRCRYCHNTSLQPGRGSSVMSWSTVMGWLATRKGLLDAVAFCGGEPTVHKSLLLAIKQVKTLGFNVALHTSGLYPHNFANLLPYLDWVGFDVKSPFAHYPDITCVPGSGGKVKESLERMLSSNISYEIRTTIHNTILSSADLVMMAHELQMLGVSRWVLQRFNKAGCADLELIAGHTAIERDLVARLRVNVPNILVR
ncbi:MAG: anaerobic ribonucleoside-triphosphate reductase activating protein [Acidithiobacillus ferriphilus]